MDSVLDFIERHKYGISLAILVHLLVFVGLNLYKVSNPVEMPQRKVSVDVELDDYELDLTPEEMQALMNRQTDPGEDPKNLVSNMNDDREKSYEDYSNYSVNDKNVKDYVKNYEQEMYKDIQNERESKGEKYLKDYNSDVKIYGGDERKKNNNAPASDKQYAGKTVLSYDLDGRGPKDNNSWHVRNPGYRCKGSGKVAVIIKVDRYGAVKDAKLDPSASTSYTDCMVSNAIKYALLSKFNYKSSAPALQTGRIYYRFIAQ